MRSKLYRDTLTKLQLEEVRKEEKEREREEKDNLLRKSIYIKKEIW